VIWHCTKFDETTKRECVLYLVSSPTSNHCLNPNEKRFFGMSVSVCSLFTPKELALEVHWLVARDMLLGENCVDQDIERALELAAASEHPQCQWLTGLFAEKTVKTVKEARDVFLADKKKSPASLCFAAVLVWDESLMR
jgi:hypothetical protein